MQLLDKLTPKAVRPPELPFPEVHDMADSAELLRMCKEVISAPNAPIVPEQIAAEVLRRHPGLRLEDDGRS